MTRWKPGFLALIAVNSLLFVGVVGCESNRSAGGSEPSPDAAVGADKYAAANPKLAKVLQAASSAAPPSDHGPPAEGVFEAGVADGRHPKGAPATVEVISTGSEPRLLLGSGSDPDAAPSESARAKSYGAAFLEVMLQRGRNAFPTVDLSLAIGPAKRDDGGADWLVGDVKRTQLARSQPGQLPPGIEKEMATLTGTTARVRVTPDGQSGEVQSELAKGTIPDLQPVAVLLGEALGLASVPLPSQAMGVDGQWIAEVRTSLAGVDVLEYRAFRVKGFEGDRVHLTVEIRAYAASRNVTFAGAPKDATVEQFEADGQGDVDVVRGEFLARKASVAERAVVFFHVAGEGTGQGAAGATPGGVVPVELRGQLVFARGEDVRALTKPM